MSKRKRATSSTGKRKRLRNYGGPRQKTGIRSAGASAAAEGAAPIRLIDADVSDVSLSHFFDKDDCTDEELVESILDSSGEIQIDEKRMLKALRKNGNEDALRDAVYREISALNLEELAFPPNVRGLLGVGGYKEQSIIKLLDDVIPKVIAEPWNESLSEFEQDLLVNNSPRPDMAVLTNGSSSNTCMDLKLGEFKNGGSYNEGFAVRQDGLYLIVLLYVLRVKLGIKVDAVYGFCLCGHKCSGLHTVRRSKLTRRVTEEGQYQITLVKVLAPTHLGQNFRVEKFSYVYPTSDVSGIQLLAHYLRCGKVAVSDALVRQKHGPQSLSVLLVPTQRWHDPYLKKNGTVAVVLGPYAHNEVVDGLRLIQTQAGRVWPRYIKDVGRYVASKAANGKRFYIKLQLRHAYVRYESTTIFPNYDTCSALRENRVLFETYPLRPYCDRNVRVILSVDRGKRIFEDDLIATQSGLQIFCQQLLVLCERTVEESYILGDALPHNIVEDDQGRLFFIDYDEGVDLVSTITRRIIDYDSHDENCWLQSLEYPNQLVAQRHDYTKVQLGLCVYVLMSFFDSVMTGPAITLLDELQSAGEKFGNYLFRLSKQKPLPGEVTIDLTDRAKAFYQMSQELLQAAANSAPSVS